MRATGWGCIGITIVSDFCPVVDARCFFECNNITKFGKSLFILPTSLRTRGIPPSSRLNTEERSSMGGFVHSDE